MVDFLNALFGGSNTQSTSTPVDMTPDAFKGLRDPFAQTLQRLLTTGGPQYGGPLTAGLGTNEQSLLSGLMDPNASGSGARSSLLNTTMNGGFLNSNPFLDAAIRAAQRPTLEGLTETLDRTLPGRFTAAGQFVQPQGSSAFDRAAAIATRGASSALGDIATNMSYQGYNDERNRQQAAIPISQQEVQTTITNLQAQALPRLIQENGIDRGIDLFKQQSQQLMQILSLLGGVTNPAIANQGQSTGSSTKGIIPGLTSMFSGGGGKGGEAAAAAGG